jgi:hypothetical protein
VSDADAVANRGDGTIPPYRRGDNRGVVLDEPRGENSENDTNEAKFYETVITIQNKEPVGDAANSGVDSGLDKPEEQPGRPEGKEAEPNQKSQISNLKSQISNGKSRDCGLGDPAAGGILRAPLSQRERRRRRQREVVTDDA